MKEQGDESLDRGLAYTDEVRGWVRSLEHEEPSLVWRSELNERLLAAWPRRRRLDWRWGSAVGVGMATAMIAFAMFAAKTQAPSTKGPFAIEDAMLASYHQSANAVAMDQARIVPEPSSGHRLEIEWTEADLGS